LRNNNQLAGDFAKTYLRGWVIKLFRVAGSSRYRLKAVLAAGAALP